MPIIITNITDHGSSGRPNKYAVRINDGPVLATFLHWQHEGLAKCLRLAAEAVEVAKIMEMHTHETSQR